MSRFKRNIPALNATSSADIAFILLLFFLLTGSLNPDEGIFRRLLPDTSAARLKQKKEIEKRNYLAFKIDDSDKILMENSPITVFEIRSVAKMFISNPDKSENLPLIAKDAVINLEVSRKTSYEAYLKVFGELSAAYSELRNDCSLERFGKSFDTLSEEEQTAVREEYPVQISETEEKEAMQ
jgi:biopolymer transport protein ExbD